jgi:transposase
MVVKAVNPCAMCDQLQAQLDAQSAQLETLRAQLDAQKVQSAELAATVARLQEQLAAARKDSSTSSKPPSSDIVAPPKPPAPDQGKRKPGGQPGHPKHERALFPADLVNGGVHNHVIDLCPCCHEPLTLREVPPRITQQVDVEIPITPLHIEEHRSYSGWCPHCQKIHYAPVPKGIEEGGLVGPRLTSLIAYLKGNCHASFSTIRKFLRDVVGVTISRGQLHKVIGKVSDSLAAPYEALFKNLPLQSYLNVDETGHRYKNERWWTWCFRASLYTLFRIDKRRSADVLLDVLGEEFNGILGCDYFGAYRRYMRECGVVLQFCLAHFIRDVKFLTTLPNAKEKAYGETLLEALRQLFRVIHKRDEMTPNLFKNQLEAARDEVLRCGTTNVPAGKHAQALAKRLTKHGQQYFEFITTPGVEPTNNLAEQAIRFVVIDRYVTQGTGSDGGNRWCERIWTVIATCTQQGRSVFDFLYQAVEALFQGEEAPSLLPQE